jgi:hypothetical protein
MINLNSIKATLLLIRYILIPGPAPEHGSNQPADGSVTHIPPQGFAAQLRTLDSILSADGRLELIFVGTLAPAAPFLLYHLKRNGFSDSQAVITPEGIKLTARR